ncbi:MAG TPA: hypothetical protein VMJ70_02700 [Candidatus Sulfotelmatobacter sp.]|nr:hypothetical protein [Candidatus Sulfotelmatobacter sp.]
MRRFLPIGILLAGAIAVLVGCGLKGVVQPTSLPDTILFVQGPVDTVNHVVHLFWFGSDAGGYISGYEVRLLNPLAPADSLWRFTTHTDTLLTVYTPTRGTSAVFEARAINDHGVRDPSPAIEQFEFRNRPPIVKFVGKPNPGDHSDTTFASVTVDWSVLDPDGDPTRVVYMLWLDGQSASPQITQSTGMTLPSSLFLQGGSYRSGFRTLYIEGVDDGGLAGPIDNVTWYVRAPVTGTRARLLLIEDVDDVPVANKQPAPARFRCDTLYANAVARSAVAPDQWSMLRLDTSHPFRSAKDLEQTFEQFETVVWYRGEQSLFSNTLANYGDGIGPYLDNGGRVYIESLNLTTAQSTAGGLSADFTNKYLRCSGVSQYPQPPDSSAAWGLTSSVPAVLHSAQLDDSLLNLRNVIGLRGFRNYNSSQILFLLSAGAASQGNTIDMPVGLDVPQLRGGRFIVQTYPLVSGTISQGTFSQRATFVLMKIFARLGLTTP